MSESLHSFFKDQYDSELARRDSIQSRLPLSLTMLGGLITAVSFLLRETPIELATGVDWLFVSGLAFSLVATGVSCFYFWRALHGWSYRVLPIATELSDYYKQLQDYFLTNTDVPGNADDSFANALMGHHSSFASENASINERRTGNIIECHTWFAIAILAVALTYLVLIFGGILSTRQSNFHGDRKTEIISIECNK